LVKYYLDVLEQQVGQVVEVAGEVAEVAAGEQLMPPHNQVRVQLLLAEAVGVVEAEAELPKTTKKKTVKQSKASDIHP
jgi:hypothetical protein